jgi:hypothetical protein
MRTVVVNTERDLAALRTRVMRPGVSEARLRAVEETIRAANPHLDLDRLHPGAVVVLPDHPDVAGDPASSAVSAIDAVGAALPKVRETVRQSAQAAARRGDDLARVLTAREVSHAADSDDELRAEVTRLGAAVAERQRRAQEWAQRVADSTAGWQAAMEELRRLT